MHLAGEWVAAAVCMCVYATGGAPARKRTAGVNQAPALATLTRAYEPLALCLFHIAPAKTKNRASPTAAAAF